LTRKTTCGEVQESVAEHLWLVGFGGTTKTRAVRLSEVSRRPKSTMPKCFSDLFQRRCHAKKKNVNEYRRAYESIDVDNFQRAQRKRVSQCLRSKVLKRPKNAMPKCFSDLSRKMMTCPQENMDEYRKAYESIGIEEASCVLTRKTPCAERKRECIHESIDVDNFPMRDESARRFVCEGARACPWFCPKDGMRRKGSVRGYVRGS